MPTTSSPDAIKRFATWKPIKPAAPVTSMVIANSSDLKKLGGHSLAGRSSQAPIGNPRGDLRLVNRSLNIDEDAAGEKAAPHCVAALAGRAMRYRQDKAIKIAEFRAASQ